MAQSRPVEELAPPPGFDSQVEDVAGVNVTRGEIPANTRDPNNVYSQQAVVTEINGKPTAFPQAQPGSDLAMSPEQLAELESRYGVTLDQISQQQPQQAPPPQPQQPPVQAQPVQQPPYEQIQQQSQPAQPPAQQQRQQITQDQLNAANQAYQQAVGIDPTNVYQDLVNMRNELQQIRQERYIEKQTSALRAEWGSDYDDRMQKVSEYYNAMPDANRNAMNNMSIVDAAKMIYAAVQQRDFNAGAQQPVNQLNHGQQIPAGQPAFSGKKIYTYEDIMSMDQETYYSAEVRAAFAEGRVKLS